MEVGESDTLYGWTPKPPWHRSFFHCEFSLSYEGTDVLFFFKKAEKEGVLLGPDIFKAESFSPTAWLF
ncbi:hypothetical protein [Leptospira wolffii]|uniref:hypothetical protein n=1 Tax=Leptospira wolffii TaxID=409998 RepID=UPI0012EB57FE|nr:hypothetical protein [Leptospira wolffii]